MEENKKQQLKLLTSRPHRRVSRHTGSEDPNSFRLTTSRRARLRRKRKWGYDGSLFQSSMSSSTAAAAADYDVACTWLREIM